MAFSVLSSSAQILFRRMGILLVGNVLWLLLSIPIVTWPAATGALFHLAHRVVLEERGQDPRHARIGDFWDGFRQLWWKSTVLALLSSVITIILLSGLWFYATSSVEVLTWLVGPIGLITLAWLGALLYVFPRLIVSPGASPLANLRSAMLAAIGYPLFTSSLLVSLLALIALCVVLLGPVLFLLFSMLAVTQTVALRWTRIDRGELAPIRSGAEPDA
jgi:uncharacterized membrane protein YesL